MELIKDELDTELCVKFDTDSRVELGYIHDKKIPHVRSQQSNVDTNIHSTSSVAICPDRSESSRPRHQTHASSSQTGSLDLRSCNSQMQQETVGWSISSS